MIPASFDYIAAKTLDEALSLLAAQRRRQDFSPADTV